MSRSSIVLLALALAGCSWAGHITRRAALPDPDGPCLQIVHPRPHQWRLYQGDRLLGDDSSDAFRRAVADDARSTQLLRRARAFAILMPVLFIPLAAAGVLLVGEGIDRDGRPNALGASGLGLLGASLAALGTVLALSEKSWSDAITGYNERARAHGCR